MGVGPAAGFMGAAEDALATHLLDAPDGYGQVLLRGNARRYPVLGHGLPIKVLVPLILERIKS